MSRLTEFDRESLSNVVDDNSGRHRYWVEGYWAQGKDPSRDGYKGRYPFPIPLNDAWPGKEEFLDKLTKIEKPTLWILILPLLTEYGGTPFAV